MSVLRDLVAEPGQEVKVQLKSESYIGELELVNHERDFIRLIKVRNHESGKAIDIPQDYFGPDIKSVLVLRPDQKKPDGEIPGQADGADGGAVADGEPSVDRVVDLDLVNELIAEHVYVDNVDELMQKTTDDLHQHRYLAVATDGSNEQEPTLLLIASSEQICIFDLLQLGGKLSDLRELLADPTICWVAHDACSLARKLSYPYGLRLSKRCFDTACQQLAGTNANGTLLTIEECLMRYLNIPRDTFDTMMLPGSIRPMTLDQRRAAAQKVAFLFGLRDYYVRENPLASFRHTVEKYSDYKIN